MSKMVSVDDYRRLVNDHSSTDQEIQAKLNYLINLFRNIIRNDKEKYVKNNKKIKAPY